MLLPDCLLFSLHDGRMSEANSKQDAKRMEAEPMKQPKEAYISRSSGDSLFFVTALPAVQAPKGASSKAVTSPIPGNETEKACAVVNLQRMQDALNAQKGKLGDAGNLVVVCFCGSVLISYLLRCEQDLTLVP